MKKISFVILLLLGAANVSYPHRQHVHQRCVVEGYNLLKKWIGGDVSQLVNHVGGVQGGSYDYVGAAPWQKGFITTGAWREDCEDVVYRISSQNPPTISGFTVGTAGAIAAAFGGSDNNDAFVSSTHFWYADNGDQLATDMYGQIYLGSLLGATPFRFTVPNAYQKMVAFAYGGFDLDIQLYLYAFPTQPDGSGGCASQMATVTFHYNSLVDLYKNRNLYVTKVNWYDGRQTVYNSPIRFTSSRWYSMNNSIYQGYDEFLNSISFEVLGRMCHLLQDIGSPAHANIDPHGGNDALRHDSFEEYFGDIGWTADMVYNQNPAVLNPYISSNPLHFLMYTMQQQANHFASNGPDMQPRNDTFAGNSLPEELTYLNGLSVSNYGGPTVMQENIPEADILNERDKLFPQIIRETAGLLYWFAFETGMLQISVPSDYPTVAQAVAAPYASVRGVVVTSGNYSITNNLTIPSGMTFQLNAGANLTFGSGTSLTVNGRLLTSGTSSQHIVFTGSTGSYWQGIFINSSASFSLQYCDFYYAHEPICATNCSNIVMDHCSFQNSDFYGTDAAALRFYNSSPVMSYCTISGQSNSWSGIRFAQGSTGSFSNGTIQNLGAGHGIIIQGNSSPTISGTTIRDVHYYGVIINGNGTASPNIFGNTFQSCGTYSGGRHYGGIYLISSTGTIKTNYITNSLFGILCDYSSSPTSGNLHPGGNIITGNDYGLIAYNSSNPTIGLTRTRVVGQITYYDGACNHIYDNVNYNVYTTNSCIVGVQRNWWGSNPPNNSKFSATNGSTIQYNPSSQDEFDECWENGGPLLSTKRVDASQSNSVGQSDSTDDGQGLLNEALDSRFNDDYAEASRIFESILDGAFTEDFKEKALAGIFDLFRDSKDVSLIRLMESRKSSYTSQGKEAVNLERAASRILMLMYAASGRYSDVRNFAQTYRTRYLQPDDDKFALTQLAMLGGFAESERSVSQSAITTMKGRYGSGVDPALLVALGITPDDDRAGAVAAETEELNLSGYPNPFNPSARIGFRLHKSGFVSLKVYDVLGREVATLINEVRQPGIHSASWNAGSMLSGVYFFRLSVAGQNVVKKMMLLK
ncbi:MAG: T9SS type A sorting domain-containing protein [Bacteroidetes bacterium]|nr:T9SS type A sorting domain-containing protein [Bacteroidota bacterium]